LLQRSRRSIPARPILAFECADRAGSLEQTRETSWNRGCDRESSQPRRCDGGVGGVPAARSDSRLSDGGKDAARASPESPTCGGVGRRTQGPETAARAGDGIEC
jgi:hypothetical protein